MERDLLWEIVADGQDLRELGCKVVMWIKVAQDKFKWWTSVIPIRTIRFHKNRKFHNHLTIVLRETGYGVIT
jgi:hypothetical protein